MWTSVVKNVVRLVVPDAAAETVSLSARFWREETTVNAKDAISKKEAEDVQRQRRQQQG